MRRHRRAKLNLSGFTIIELLVICAIIAVLAAIAIPGFSMWMPRYRLKQATRDLYSTIQTVKMTAIKNNQSADISFSAAPHQYQYGVASGVTRTVVLSEYGSGVKFDNPGHTQTFTSPTITFDGRGFCNAGDVFISNQNNTGYFKLSTQTSGVIQLEEIE